MDCRLWVLMFTALALSARGDGLEFEMVEEPPQKAVEWSKVVFGNGRFVAAAKRTAPNGRRALFTSETGTNWVERILPGRAGVGMLRFVNNRFLVMGDGLLSSFDGINWVRLTDWEEESLYGFEFANNIYVAIGRTYSFTSSNGVHWTQHRIDPAVQYVNSHGLAFGNGKFMILGWQNVYTSTDGTSWQKHNSNLAVHQFSNELKLSYTFGAFRYGNHASADGVNWSLVSSNSNYLFSENRVMIGSRLFGVNNGIGVSEDGISWELVFRPPSVTNHVSIIASIAYGNGTYVAVGHPSYLAYSTNLVDWTELKHLPHLYYSITFANGTFLRYKGQEVSVSSDALTWTNHVITETFTKITGAGNKFYGFTSNGVIYESSSGVEWNVVTNLAGAVGIFFGNGTYIATLTNNVRLVSADGVDWEPMGGISGVDISPWMTANEMIIARGSDRYLYESIDGKSWSKLGEIPIYAAHLAYGNGRFVGISPGGMGFGRVYTSIDGRNWIDHGMTGGSSHLVYSFKFAGGHFIQAASSGDLYVSRTGTNWTGYDAGATSFGYLTMQQNIAEGNGKVVVTGSGGVMLVARTTPEPEEWWPIELARERARKAVVKIRNTEPAGSAEVQASADMKAWSPIATFDLSTTNNANVEVDTGDSQEFYRARRIRW